MNACAKHFASPETIALGNGAMTKAGMRSSAFIANVNSTENEILVIFVDNYTLRNIQAAFWYPESGHWQTYAHQRPCDLGNLEEMETIYLIVRGIVTGFGYEPDLPLWIERKRQRPQ
jgi:hypothetical protein